MQTIELQSGRKIGDGQPPFIVAEVGSNWRDFNDAKDSISKAKACGADAVKFQAFTGAALYGFPSTPVGEELELPLDWLPRLKEKADVVGIEFMCTAFSPELYDAVDPYVSVHKVASAELTHKRILEKLKALGKPVILSTGASGKSDIKEAIRILGDTPLILMYCVAAYPAKLANPWLIPILRSEYGKLVGYSDHALDALVTPVVAANQGACVIEKHVNFAEAESPDSPHSLSTEEFKLMVRAIRGQAVSSLGPTVEEQGMVSRHNRRLIATRPLSPGDALIEGENFGIYRALRDDLQAAHPFQIDDIKGKTVKRAIEAGQGIAPGDVNY